MHIGIVGSGIAGLSAAWLLNRAGVRVTILERENCLGMAGQCVDFEVEGNSFCCDVPPRMFNDSLWPKLSKLYRLLGVESVPVEPSKSYGQFLGGASWLRLGASYQPKLSSNLLLNSTTRSILSDISKMMNRASRDLQNLTSESMKEYLSTHQFSESFIHQFLYPTLSATVCTCSYGALDEYPAKTLLESMLSLTRPEGLRRTRYGTRDVVNRMSQGISDVLFAAHVRSISQIGDQAIVEAGDTGTLKFDHVLVATQANAASNLMSEEAVREFQALSKFRYENVPVVVHTDKDLMPTNPKDWSHFNFLTSGSESAMCTIWMNRFYPEWKFERPVFETIMPLVDANPESVIGSAVMQRPVVNGESVRGIALLDQLHNDSNRRIWFCGSYACAGIPLLESAVQSSLNVVKRIGISMPDECLAG